MQSGYHLFQHGEMILIRLIYLYEGPTPDDLIKKSKEESIKEKKLNNDSVISSNNEISNPIVNISDIPSTNKKDSNSDSVLQSTSLGNL